MDTEDFKPAFIWHSTGAVAGADYSQYYNSFLHSLIHSLFTDRLMLDDVIRSLVPCSLQFHHLLPRLHAEHVSRAVDCFHLEAVRPTTGGCHLRSLEVVINRVIKIEGVVEIMVGFQNKNICIKIILL